MTLPRSSALLLLLLPLACHGLVTSYKRVNRQTIEFGASLKFDNRITSARRADVVDYLSDPRNVLSAAWPPEHILPTPDASVFRLRQGPLDFIMLDVTTLVDCHVATDAVTGAVRLSSRGIENTVRGPPPRRATQTVHLELQLDGGLEPQPADEGAVPVLRGAIGYTAKATLPGPLILIPDTALRSAVAGLNALTLAYAERRFVSGISSAVRRGDGRRRTDAAAAVGAAARARAPALTSGRS